MLAIMDEKTPDVRYWIKEINSAKKREKSYLSTGRRVVDIYEARQAEGSMFNILYSNTEVLAPAVYSAEPIPIVERRFKDSDPVGRLAAEMGTRILKYFINSQNEEYDSFSSLMKDAVLNGLVPGRGPTRFRYDAEIENEEVSYETICGEPVRWDRILWGYATTWRKVPWVAFIWVMTKDEVLENYKEIGPKISFGASEDENRDSSGDKEGMTDVNLVEVIELWDKTTKKVYFFTPNHNTEYLKPPIDDPYKLTGFFPTPQPLAFTRKISTLVPTPLYIWYESQAKELNQITARLKKLIEALKIRGFYDATVEGIEKVLLAGDNEMIPAENMASMPDSQRGEKLLWLVPIENIVQVVQYLYQQREACKQTIYEITGISDILRGSSVASETATAQKLKNQWGTLRLRHMQREVSRYCQDCLKIILELAVTKLSPDTLQKLTGLEYIREQEKAFLQMQAQNAQMTGQQIPEEIQKKLSSPSFEEVLELLKNDTLRSYRIGVETNSTLEASASEDKQDITELLTAISQFLQGVQPLVTQGVMPFQLAQSMLLTITRRFTFGSQVEEALLGMTPPQPKSDPAIQMKLEAEKAKMQAEAQKLQIEMQLLQAETQAKMQISQMDLEIRREEFEFKKKEMAMKSEAAVLNHQLKLSQKSQKGNSVNAAV